MFGFGKFKRDRTAIDLLRAGKQNEALTHFAARLRENVQDAEAMIEIAKIHFRAGDLAEAKEWLRVALAHPLNPEQERHVLDMTNFRKLASDRHLNSFPCFSPDGRSIAFTSARRDTNGDGKIGPEDRPGLYLVDVRTGRQTELAFDEWYNAQPSFTPDGARVVFLSARADTNADGRIDHTDAPAVYMKDLNSGREEVLVEARFRPKFPSLSPDGNVLLFCAWQPGSAVCGVYTLELRSRATRMVHDQYESNFPVFSPDGRRVLFSNWRTDTNRDGRIDLRDNSCLCERRLDTGQERVIAPDLFSNSYPGFSPDGESIVYLSRRRDTNGDGLINSLDNSGIYLLDLERNKERKLVDDGRYNKYPAFTHDGRSVVFLATWNDKNKRLGAPPEYFENKGIHRIDLDGGGEREIVSTKHYGCKFLRASPAENKVAYVAWYQDSLRGLYLADLDHPPAGEELKALVENNL